MKKPSRKTTSRNRSNSRRAATLSRRKPARKTSTRRPRGATVVVVPPYDPYGIATHPKGLAAGLAAAVKQVTRERDLADEVASVLAQSPNRYSRAAF